MQSERVSRRVKRSFLGEGNSETYRKGQIINIEPQRAAQYDAQGLTAIPSGPPSKAKAQAASAALKAEKSMQPAETKERGGADTKATGRK